MSYLKRLGTRRVPQSAPIPDSGQVPNSAGGFAWTVDCWTRLRRFLILGSEGGSYYASESKLTRRNAKAVADCLAEDGPRAVAEIVRVSREGRAPKNDPAIFALAMAAGRADEETRKAALEALPLVCRTGTHLFQFATFVEGFRGWGRSLRRAVGRWYSSQEVDALAYQAVKYRQREGVTHRDLLRLAHPAERVSAGNPTLAVSAEHARLFEWIVRGGSSDGLPRIVEGFARAQVADGAAGDSGARPRVPAATRGAEDRAPGVARGLGGAARGDADDGADPQPRDDDTRRPARLGLGCDGSRGRAARRRGSHPARTRAPDRGARSSPDVRVGSRCSGPQRVAAGPSRSSTRSTPRSTRRSGTSTPTGKRLLLALDVSGSMESGWVAGIPGLSPRDASAALALVTAATEQDYEIVGFYAGRGGWKAGGRRQYYLGENGITPLSISPRQRLDDAVKAVSDLPFGGTDCALPMLYAQAKGMEIDTFVIYTDSETWAGNVHPANALRDYRRASGIDARLVVVGMVSNGFSIADPTDPGMLDVVGFDTATPQLISDFARGEI